jgi:uncharacterized protein DUF4265
MASDIAIHDAPVWREQANFLIFADLSDGDLHGRWEQLWARQLGDDEFVLCCIPYFTYGMALGDHVRTGPTKGRKYVVSAITACSGHRVVRCWLKDATLKGRERLESVLGAGNLLHEWSSTNLVAIDVAGKPGEELSAFLETALASSIAVEWGDAP